GAVMAGEAIVIPETRLAATAPPPSLRWSVFYALRNSLLVGGGLLVLAAIFEYVLNPAIASVQVDESVTSTLAGALTILTPPAMYVALGVTLRPLAATRRLVAIIIVSVIVVTIYGLILAAQYSSQTGPFSIQKTLQFTLVDTPEGVLVESVEPGGAADQAGLQPGDVITAIRRDNVNAAAIATYIM